ncbi:cyclin-dependent kinase 2-associated protein 2-like [Corticium candelabrum]|uniref:cyclin-dependent kinase 2-associated protein 2-like n=1 Tax=Corticium candelabrum TaxID=121492 RepID=UPI002E261A53|nr:cyclin-dependent kinase 2-associated protein 2-like [Corticium candelabrum]
MSSDVLPQTRDDEAGQGSRSSQGSTGAVSLPKLLETKYTHLMSSVEEMGKYVKPCYSGSKISVEKLRKEIQQARALTKECLATVDLIGQQQDQRQN